MLSTVTFAPTSVSSFAILYFTVTVSFKVILDIASEAVLDSAVTVGVTVGTANLDISTLVTDGIALAVFVTLGVEVIVGVVVLPLFAAAEEDAACC